MKINGYTIEQGANLEGADLYGADLYGADLYGANLQDASFWGASFWGANLQGADLQGASFWGANLQGADLRNANFYNADLRNANLYGADLRDTDLRGANLWGALGGILAVTGLPSEDVTLVPTCDGWVLRVGDWAGNPASFRALIAQDDERIEAQGEETTLRVQIMAALADLCDAYAAAHQDDLAAVAHWADEDEDDR